MELQSGELPSDLLGELLEDPLATYHAKPSLAAESHTLYRKAGGVAALPSWSVADKGGSIAIEEMLGGGAPMASSKVPSRQAAPALGRAYFRRRDDALFGLGSEPGALGSRV
jgi:hypothetical protein